MKRHLPPLNALRSFEAASRVLSFTRAAEELNVTPAAVSHQIKVLEDRLGIRLFTRANNRIQLTDRGKTYVPVVRRALDMISDATSELCGDERDGLINVSLTTTFAVRWLIPRVSNFGELHPDIEVQLSTTDRAVDFMSENYDAAIRFGAGSWPGLSADPLFNEELVPVCSPVLAASLGMIETPDDLQRYPLLISNDCEQNWALWLHAVGAKTVSLENGIRHDSYLLAMQAAIDGQGVAAANLEYVRDDLEAGRLVQIYDVSLPKRFGWHFCCAEADADRRPIAAFRAWLLNECRHSQSEPSVQFAAE